MKINRIFKISLVAMFFLIVTNSIAQVGIGTLTPDPSAMLEVISTDKGFLVPRMTTTEKEAISAATGLLVFDTTLNMFSHWDGFYWINHNSTDSDAIGNLYWDTAQTSAISTTASKIVGTSTAVNLIDFTDGGADNRLMYTGKYKRVFSISCSMSFNSDGLPGGFFPGTETFSFYIARGDSDIPSNTAILPETKVQRYVVADSDIGALAIVGTVLLQPGEWIEVWAQLEDGSNTTFVVNTCNLIIE